MIILKIGGGKKINLGGIIRDLPELNDKVIIVHGANALCDRLRSDLGREKKILTSVSGYSSIFSDKDEIDLKMMSYAGLQNKRIVELCQQNGINAVGLSGIDGKSIQGQRNKGIKIKENEKLKIVRDLSGKPGKVNKELLDLLLDNGYVPVLCIPIIDEDNFAINSENDDIVNALQDEFKADRIIQLIEAPGFLENGEDPSSLIKSISWEELEKKEELVEGRMKRKLLSLRKLFKNSDTAVLISDGRTEHPLKDALSGKGTIIQ